MRKITIFLVTLLALSIPTAFAQEETPTLAELVIQQTEAEPSELTVLLAAVQAADPMILEALTTPTDYNGWTVFAPTDAAFAAAFDTLGVTPEEVLANQNLLNLVLAYHVIPANLPSDILGSVEGEYYVGTLLPDHPLKMTNDENGLKVNDANIVNGDVQASNGVVHIIDMVLIPEGLMDMAAGMTTETRADGGTIADAAAANGNLSTLVSAIGEIAEEHPEVVDLVSDPAVQVTMFAPTNDAFGALPEETLSAVQANTNLLAVVLGYHVLPGVFTADGLMALGNMMEEGSFNVLTAAGLPVQVTISDEGIVVGGAPVTTPDLMADNGIVHVVDSVIVPPVE